MSLRLELTDEEKKGLTQEEIDFIEIRPRCKTLLGIY